MADRTNVSADQEYIRELEAENRRLYELATDECAECADLRERLRAAEAEVHLLKAAIVRGRAAYSSLDYEHQLARADLAQAQAQIEALRKALTGAREAILDLKNSRWSEAEGTDEEWVAEIDAALKEPSHDH